MVNEQCLTLKNIDTTERTGLFQELSNNGYLLEIKKIDTDKGVQQYTVGFGDDNYLFYNRSQMIRIKKMLEILLEY